MRKVAIFMSTRRAARLVLLLFAFMIAWGGSDGTVHHDPELSYKAHASEAFVLRNVNAGASFNQVLNQLPSFDWLLGEFVIDFPSHQIANTESVVRRYKIIKILYVFIATNAP